MSYESDMMKRQRSRSPASRARLVVRNRRKRYLECHTEYFEEAQEAMELADPLTYDRLVRQFQTTQEREDEGRRKGRSGILESDLQRSEARASAAAASLNGHGVSRWWRPDGNDAEVEAEEEEGISSTKISENSSSFNTRSGTDLSISRDELREAPTSKGEGLQQWKHVMELRFLHGHDNDFAYETVDDNEAYDDERTAERERQEEWFETESPGCTIDAPLQDSIIPALSGQTGIQDF